MYRCVRTHTLSHLNPSIGSAHTSIRQHTSAYVSIRCAADAAWLFACNTSAPCVLQLLLLMMIPA